MQFFPVVLRIKSESNIPPILKYSAIGQILTDDPHFYNNVLAPLQLAVRSCDVLFYDYRLHTERRSVSASFTIDNAHCVVLSFQRNMRKSSYNVLHEKH